MALKKLALIIGFALALLLSVAAAAQDVDTDAATVMAVDDDQPVANTTLSVIDEDDMRTAFRRMKRRDDLQFELRTELPPPPEPTPRWLRWIGEALDVLFQVLAPVFVAIFWMGVGALAMVLLYAVALGLFGLRERLGEGDDAKEAGAQEYRPDARTVRVLLSDADALAAEGRYAEAVHLLLYRSIQDIERSRPEAVRLSMTSREIARSSLLGANTRTTFAALARMVERSHFGGDAVTAEDYAEARAVYERFVAPGGVEAATAPVVSGLTA